MDNQATLSNEQEVQEAELDLNDEQFLQEFGILNRAEFHYSPA